MGSSHSKADRSCAQVEDGVESPSLRKEPPNSEPSPQPPNPHTSVLLDGVTTQLNQSEDVARRRAEQMFQDLGLGRGIDATRIRPWLNRTPLQVRPVYFSDLIGTEEGGSLEVYKEVTLSSHSLHWKMLGELAAPITGDTVAAPAPASHKLVIGVDSDYTRPISAEQCVIGRRVINRTISFRESIQDSPFLSPGFSSSSESCGRSEKSTFENELFKWILERCRYKLEGQHTARCEDEHTAPARSDGQEHPVRNLAMLFHLLVTQSKSTEMQEAEGDTLDDKTAREFQHLCKQFVQHHHATHYVSAIQLGAAEYGTITVREYLKEVKLTGNFGVSHFVTTRLEASKSSRKAKKTHQYWTIGTIMGEGKSAHVPHSIEKEAVIKVEIKPIYHLVHDAFLGNVLKNAIQEYISEQRDCHIGPFYIVSTRGSLHETVTIYLTLDENYHLCATCDKDKAMAFKIIPSESKKQNEFNIVYEEDFESKLSSRYCLCTPLTVRGTSSSPPHFQIRSKRKDCQFVLHAPLHNRGAPAQDLEPWLCGHRGYFIHCSGQRFQLNGYLAIEVYQHEDGNSISYVPTCCSSRNAGEHYSMIFKLLLAPPTYPRP